MDWIWTYDDKAEEGLREDGALVVVETTETGVPYALLTITDPAGNPVPGGMIQKTNYAQLLRANTDPDATTASLLAAALAYDGETMHALIASMADSQLAEYSR